MKFGLILTDLLFNVRRELGHQTSDYDTFGDDNIAERGITCGNYLKLGNHSDMFRSETQFSA